MTDISWVSFDDFYVTMEGLGGVDGLRATLFDL